MSNNNVYNVVVDFEKLSDAKDDDEVMEEFPAATHVEGIGPNQIQVGYGVCALNEAEAYRAAVNLVEARIGVSAVGPIGILSATVYGEDEEYVY